MSSARVPGQTGNRLLDRLSRAELEPLLSASRRVELGPGHEVHEQGAPVPYAYFPSGVVLSETVRLEEGKQLEAATIGNEGVLGLSVFLGMDFSPFTVITQIPGEAYRVPTRALGEAMGPGATLDRLLRRYAAYRLRQGGQTIACNALHSVEERMCRWLLTTHDRAGRDEFLLTHEFLAEMLGIRRQSVTVTAGRLQRAGFITYRRGAVQVEHRRGLEEASCECYGVSRSLYDRLLG